jgi:hypothetical protein
LRLFNSTLQYKPQPTQPSEDAPVAIVVGGKGSGHGNDDSDNIVGDSDNGVDGSSNRSGNCGGIDNGDGSNGGSSDKEVAAKAITAGTNNNQLKLAAEKTVVMAAAATAIAAGTNNNQLKVVVEKTVVVTVVVAMAAAAVMATATAARTRTTPTRTAAVEAVAAAAVVMGVAMAAVGHSATCRW